MFHLIIRLILGSRSEGRTIRYLVGGGGGLGGAARVLVDGIFFTCALK